ncbi:hypothetical protein [Clostridium beijerinckii]|uniref:Uncharacterized protein n=1 Tax=Clostridium beijerinckii TaxID=1520 RepID=A0AAW3W5Z4_CLOBE|nr:hypothetical protein [Clostridium beijerinckii]MBC2457145.1 hypothetical protein [Clostridium beijerinckii]MBC2474202.1 hypothetical protein [Clostridium beijerinckii]NOV58699.1 hypothetical protein [Clostridium beijerinckii]NOV71916.1 hypothetical protein [Clostridium beijerinckii]NOW32054.1 hypothetical protein [Clostridium beijerinckii]
MSTILNKTPAIRLFNGTMMDKLDEATARVIAEALRAGKIVLSADTQVLDGVYELHEIKYAGVGYHIAVPYGFDVLMQYTYDYSKDGRIVDMLLV